MPLALRANHLQFRHKPDIPLLEEVSFELAEGTLTMLMGASGSGKSTLLKVLAGFLQPQQGSLEILGQPAQGIFSTSLRLQVGYIPQQLGLVRHLTALENVLMGTLGKAGVGAWFGVFPASEKKRALDFLDQLGIVSKADEKVHRLSGGERQRVAIARTLLQQPKIVLADEFVSDLDFQTAVETLFLVRRLMEQERITFLMSMHEVQLVKMLAETVLILNRGKIQTQCAPTELSLEMIPGAFR